MESTPVLSDLTELVAPWRQQAACRGLGPERFYIGQGRGAATAAKEVCARCPVALDCLERAVSTREEHGIHGGAGEQARRAMRRAWHDRPHGPGVVDGCPCAWCVLVSAHLAKLAGTGRRLGDLTTAGVTHGLRITYAKGCRCAPCHWSASAPGQAVARLGERTSWWWSAWAPDNATDEDRRETADAAACELIMDLVVGLSVLAGVAREQAVTACREWVAAPPVRRPVLTRARRAEQLAA